MSLVSQAHQDAIAVAGDVVHELGHWPIAAMTTVSQHESEWPQEYGPRASWDRDDGESSVHLSGYTSDSDQRPPFISMSTGREVEVEESGHGVDGYPNGDGYGDGGRRRLGRVGDGDGYSDDRIIPPRNVQLAGGQAPLWPPGSWLRGLP